MHRADRSISSPREKMRCGRLSRVASKSVLVAVSASRRSPQRMRCRLISCTGAAAIPLVAGVMAVAVVWPALRRRMALTRAPSRLAHVVVGPSSRPRMRLISLRAR